MTESSLAEETTNNWGQFLAFAKKKLSPVAYVNWIEPISIIQYTETQITLEVPNIFVKEYLLANHSKDLTAFIPVNNEGKPAIEFIIKEKEITKKQLQTSSNKKSTAASTKLKPKLHDNYRFQTFIEGAENQFVKSAALGVSSRPGKSYNPLIIHGGVGLGKTHILHSIGHAIIEKRKDARIHCLTTEEFINDLIEHLKSKSLNKMKNYYRSEIDVLLVDDLQFLQGRENFEEEFCNTLEALIHQNKQIVITSDKPPSLLKLSERITARMEWGLVAHIGAPELETRVAILQNKAQQRGLILSNEMAFKIAERVYQNVRQLEGAINRLCVHSKILGMEITEDLVEKTLSDMLQYVPRESITIDDILKYVSKTFQVGIADLRKTGRKKEVVIPRQIAMYLACKLEIGTLQSISDLLGKTHSTILHAKKNIEKKLETDELLRRQVQLIEKHIVQRDKSL
jgi:chromosomal replication initiator protein